MKLNVFWCFNSYTFDKYDSSYRADINTIPPFYYLIHHHANHSPLLLPLPLIQQSVTPDHHLIHQHITSLPYHTSEPRCTLIPLYTTPPSHTTTTHHHTPPHSTTPPHTTTPPHHHTTTHYTTRQHHTTTHYTTHHHTTTPPHTTPRRATTPLHLTLRSHGVNYCPSRSWRKHLLGALGPVYSSDEVLSMRGEAWWSCLGCPLGAKASFKG